MRYMNAWGRIGRWQAKSKDSIIIDHIDTESISLQNKHKETSEVSPTGTL